MRLTTGVALIIGMTVGIAFMQFEIRTTDQVTRQIKADRQ